MKNLGPRPKLFLSTSFDIRRRVINHSECVAGGSSNDNDPPLHSPKCIYIYIYIERLDTRHPHRPRRLTRDDKLGSHASPSREASSIEGEEVVWARRGREEFLGN